jgi:WD40 repeat protein
LDTLAISVDGKILATGSSDNTASLWEVQDLISAPASAQPVRIIQAGYTILSLAFSPDGKQLAIGNMSHQVRVVGAETGSLLFYLSGHKDQVFSVAYSPDGSMIATGSADKQVRLYNARDGKLLVTLPGNTSSVNQVEFSNAQTTLFSAGEDGVIRLYGIPTGP